MPNNAANPYATGGGGSDFENQVGASYLAAVLLGAPPRGLEAGRADEVRFQRRSQGEPLDDLVVFAELPDARAKLSLQIKRHIAYGAHDVTFNEIVSACWATFKAPDFNPDLDRFGIACGLSPKIVDQHYQTVLEYAQTSVSALDFLARVTSPVQSKHQANFLNLIRGCLEVAACGAVTDDELWRFLRALVILRFDLQQGGSGDRTSTVTSLASLLPVEDQMQAPHLLDRLAHLAAQGNRTAGSFDRRRLTGLLQSAGFRLLAGQRAIRTSGSDMVAESAISAPRERQQRTSEGRRAMHPMAQRLPVMRERFFHLLESHKVPITVVPTLLRDFGMRASILEDERALADVLDEDLVAFLSETFYVDRAWLRGSSLNVTTSPPYWYKAPHVFCRSVAEACTINPRVHVHFVRNSKPTSRLRRVLGGSPPDVGIIVEREHHPAAGVAFSTYQRWYEQEWDYWKCQLFYKALILFCDRAKAPPALWYGGEVLKPDAFAGLVGGELLPVEVLSSGVCDRWYPDDYICEGCELGHHNADLSKVKEIFAGYHLGSYLESPSRDR